MPGQGSGGKIHSGDPFEGINAHDWNSFLDAVEWVRDQQGSGTKAGKKTGIARSSTIVKVRNSTGIALDQFHVVGIDLQGYLFNPATFLGEFKRKPTFDGKFPDCTKHVGRFGICVDPIGTGAPGNVGDVVISGVVQVQIDIQDTAHEYADIYDGVSDRLTSVSEGSAQILSVQSGLGLKWALVRLGNFSGGACVTTTAEAPTTTTGEDPPATTTGEDPPATTTAEAPPVTTTTECPVFSCEGICQITLEVVTDVICGDEGIEVTKTAICLETWRVDLSSSTTAGA